MCDLYKIKSPRWQQNKYLLVKGLTLEGPQAPFPVASNLVWCWTQTTFLSTSTHPGELVYAYTGSPRPDEGCLVVKASQVDDLHGGCYWAKWLQAQMHLGLLVWVCSSCFGTGISCLGTFLALLPKSSHALGGLFPKYRPRAVYLVVKHLPLMQKTPGSTSYTKKGDKTRPSLRLLLLLHSVNACCEFWTPCLLLLMRTTSCLSPWLLQKLEHSVLCANLPSLLVRRNGPCEMSCPILLSLT